MKRITLALAALTTLTLGLTSCQVYPSGCIRIPSNEIPWPYVWNSQTLAVHHQPAGQPNAPLQFVGASVKHPRYYFTDTWRGPARYTGWAIYASALNCLYSSGAYAGE